jgi:peptide/nickel transport system ATP-binding protein
LTTPLLEIKNLHVWFEVFGGVLKVLDGVSLEVREGEKVGVVGETGCGKTVTMKAMMGVLPMPPGRIPKGEILFQGKDILKMSSTELRNMRGRDMSMIPQGATESLNPVFTIGDQLMAVIRYSGDSQRTLSKQEMKGRAMDILKEVRIPDAERIMRSYAIQLSGGMRQRVLIGMALATEATLLIADEPSTALDVTTQEQILRLMREMVEKRSVSIIIITHNLGVVRQLTDRTYIMYAGSVVEVARTRDLFSEAMHPYTRGLMNSVPKLSGKGIAPGIKGVIPDYFDPPQGCRFRPRCDQVMTACEEKPPLFKVREDHEVACFLYQI